MMSSPRWGLIGGPASGHFLSAAQRHEPDVGERGTVSRTKRIHCRGCSDGKEVFRPAASQQLESTRQGQFPGRDRLIWILHVEIEADVRVGPLDLRDDASEYDRLLVVVLHHERVVGEQRSA